MDKTATQLEQAFALFDQGKLQQAREQYQALEGRLSSLSIDQQRAVFMGLTYVESADGQFDRALSFAKRLLNMAEGFVHTHTALHQLAMVYRMQGDFPLALELLSKERQLIAEHGNDALLLAVNGYETGYIALLLGKLELARTRLLQALENAQSAGDAMTLGCVYRALGQAASAQDKPREAAQLYRQSLLAFQDTGDEMAMKEVTSLLHALNP